MWFMAPYGSWIYAGFVEDDAPVFKKIDIGSSNANYPMSDWDFAEVAANPEDKFVYEQDEGGPNGAIGCGCIRGATAKLYVLGKSTSSVSPNTIIHRFVVADGFSAGSDTGCVPLDTVGGGGDPVEMNHVAGLDVDQGTAFYIVTNNNDGNEFQLRRYAYPVTWDGSDVDPSHEVDLSPNYMSNNTLARIRGIAIANDGNIIVFVNTGSTATSCRVLKFDKDDLSYLGQTTWAPSISTSIWGYVVMASEVFMLFEGLNSNSSLAWKSAIYYDRATQIPDADRSNFVIGNNLTTFGSDDPITLEYHARDAFNVVIPSVNTKFVINGEDPDDSSTWTDRIGSIQDNTGDTFFDANGVPTSIQAIAATNASGIATAYYKPMRSGSGSEIDDIDVYCPSDS
jgi:hypothetical protein